MADYTRIGSFYPGSRMAAPQWVIPVKHIPRKRGYHFIKRVSDIGVSLLLVILVLSWLTPLLALIIRLDSEGPVIFQQKRVGKGGRLFMCYKFRTMVLNREADACQATENDPRITRSGRWMRRSNINELLQLINLLMGEMSLFTGL